MGWSREAMAQGVLGFFQTCIWLIRKIGLFWLERFWQWMTTKSDKHLLIETLHTAREFEEWHASALQLDRLLGNDMWRKSTGDYPRKYYNDALISERTELLENALANATDDGDIMLIHDILRSGLTRNIGGVLNPKLYSKANAGTKLIIEDYLSLVVDAIRLFATWPTALPLEEGLTPQMKLDLLHDARMSYGRTVLVLQGGSIFGLCHLGVVKAMYQRGLLPRIIAGTATGALMAAWVGVHTENELMGCLSGEKIDLGAFAASSERAAANGNGEGVWLWLQTLQRRVMRFFKSGFILDPEVLEESVRANVGEMTFEEAYNKTQRILNITISPSGPGAITLLNYLTAPNVLIWSAALVSNAANRSKTSIRLMCKDANGHTVPYETLPQSSRPYRSSPGVPKESPLSRLGELFNVDHFVISQARPYVAPFLYPLPPPFPHKHLRSLLSPGIKRLLMDEIVPGPSLILVPEIRPSDWARLLRNPTHAEINHWIERGEKSVWPNAVQLAVRLSVEQELEKAYQLIRRANSLGEESARTGGGKAVKRRKARAASAGKTSARM
ncbi:hypothetical protein Q7P37_001260 [Cladosporium fusiforme]